MNIGITCKDNDEDNREPSWKRPGGEKRRRRKERENSIQARQLAKRNSWTRCPFCKEMVEKKVKSSSMMSNDPLIDTTYMCSLNRKDAALFYALVSENCKCDVITNAHVS